jgi:hypothetical protein
MSIENDIEFGSWKSFFRTWFYGLRSGFPVCCIHEFVQDNRRGELPAQLRQGCAERGFVPCSKCGWRLKND